MFSVQRTTHTDQLTLTQGMANLDALSFRIDDPCDLRAACKKILQPIIDLAARVGQRMYFHRQVRRALKEVSHQACQCSEPRFGDERNVWSTAIFGVGAARERPACSYTSWATLRIYDDLAPKFTE